MIACLQCDPRADTILGMRSIYFFLILMMSVLSLVATPEQCAAIRVDYTKRTELWALTLQGAKDLDTQKKIWAQRPDGIAVSAKLWKILQPQMTQEWTLEHAAWLIKLVCSEKIEPQQVESLQMRATIIQQISKVVADKHLRSSKLAPICLALLAVGDQTTLKLLEKIEKDNPSGRVQGVAAIAIAYVLRGLGDEPALIRRRLTLIRKAVIESNDVTIDGVSVQQLASDQLYFIQNLAKGMQAPELSGLDQAGATRKLSLLKGKVVILLFWSDTMSEATHFLEMTRQLKAKYVGKNCEILGVYQGAIPLLRTLHTEQIATWTNITDPKGSLSKDYRISQWPTAYVIDAKGSIQYSGNPGSFVELTADALLAP
jgi:peroxiredoxin